MATRTFRRGMWVWNGYSVAATPAAFITECKRIGITDVYLYLTAGNYTKTTVLQSFITKLSDAKIKAWGLDGGRSYFNDANGPAGILATLNGLVAYNKKVPANAKFYGYQTDNEFDDYSGNYKDTFHNDVLTSKLSRTSGGVHTKSAYDDRLFILKDMLVIQSLVAGICKKNLIKNGAAVPSWYDDYYGEPLSIGYNGKTTTLMKHMMEIVDDYAIMSYQTDMAKVAQRINTELVCGSTLGKAVFAGVETVKGRGPQVTYGDHSTKKYKSAVIKDIVAMEKLFGKHTGFAGVNIHDWTGWSKLAA